MMNQAATERYCSHCGIMIEENTEECPNCRGRQAMKISAGRSRILAALLAVILGGFGIHKFFVGNTLMGIVYLLFSWTYVPFLIAIVEALFFAVMTDSQFDRKYNYAGV